MDLIVPARVSEAQIERAQELAVRAFIATDCEGMARADLFVRARRRGARQRAEHDPGLHLDERVRAAVRTSPACRTASCSTGSPTSRSNASTPRATALLTTLRRFWNPWRLLGDAHIPDSVATTTAAAFDELLGTDARRAASSTTDLPQPKWWFLHHQIARGFLRARLERAGDRRVPHPAEPRRAPAARSRRSSPRTTRSGRSTSPSSTARSPRATSTGASTSATGRATSSRSAPTRATSVVDDGDDLPPAARDVPRDAVEPRARERGAGAAARAADRRARRLSVPQPHPRAPARRVGPQRLAAERAQVAVTSLIARVRRSPARAA